MKKKGEKSEKEQHTYNVKNMKKTITKNNLLVP